MKRSLFCTYCHVENEFTVHIIQEYFISNQVKHFYCTSCHKKNRMTEVAHAITTREWGK
ncbi:hypothetical protein ACEPPU_24270 [Priestia aryabhattai]|uniref:hypothetical protein n=1 Tax=Priestia aryabhattai TaxID=412384 RepID=UPI0035AB896E